MSDLPGARARNLPVVLLGVGIVVFGAAAVVALIVALTRSGSGANPTYTAAQKAEAKTELCDQYQLAVYAVQVESHVTDNAALARIAETNGANILEIAADDPALDSKHRDAARALAAAFRSETALGSRGREDPRFQAAVDDTNAKGSIMRGLCGD